MATLPSYEALGSFYLGREYDAERGADRPDLLLYDSRDLTTHAVCVGMTGSGKTGLCLSLLEEAAIDGVPAIAIDPKGDLGNLLLSFPELRPEDFAPWIDTGAAAPPGPHSRSKRRQRRPKPGARAWPSGNRTAPASPASAMPSISRSTRRAAKRAGRYRCCSRSRRPPPSSDSTAARCVNVSVRQWLACLGWPAFEADPIQSREHILLATLFDQAWSAGRDLTLAALIQGIQKPPFDKVGVFDLETFLSSEGAHAAGDGAQQSDRRRRALRRG